MSRSKRFTSRARAQGSPTEQRVQEIVKRMARGEWTAKQALELSEMWGLSVSRVHQISSEASRRIRISLGDEEEMRARVLAHLDEVGSRALAKGQLGEATRAAKVFGDIAGLVVERVDATVRVAQMSDAEIDAEIMREAERIRRGKER